MIRILHTADWHLGREFHGRDLTELHERFFDWLAAEIETRGIDLLLMAGDIFDRALPPVGAVRLFNRQLARLSDLTEVLLITGNHDSVVRMGHGQLMKPSIHLRCGVERLGEPVLTGDGSLALYAIPYLDPITMASELDLDESTHAAVLSEAARRCREDLESRPGTRSIAIGHAFITGGEESESERSIQVGGSDNVAASVFEGFDYVALGHLHRPQRVSETIRYSGSPIPLSFSEVGAGQPKSVTVLELSADGSLRQEQVEVPQQVAMSRIRGSLEQLLDPESFTEVEEDWLEVTLTDPIRPAQPMDRLRARFANVVSLRFESPISGSSSGQEVADLARIAKTDPAELVASFIREVRGSDPDEAERALVREALDQATGSETVG